MRSLSQALFLSATRQACRSLAAAARRLKSSKMMAAFTMAVSCAAAPCAHASIITMTFTGTVNTGNDITGVFGMGPVSSLSGQSFTLVYSFDDTKGTQSTINPGSGICGTEIMSTSTSNPGTAVLTIGKGSYTFGTIAGGATSSAERLIGSVCSGYLDAKVTDTQGSQSAGNFISDSINALFGYPGSGSTIPTTDYHWQDDFSATNLANGAGLFQIYAEASDAITDEANGTLIANNITITGGPASTGPGGGATGLQFVPVTPCRVADTRNATGPFGGPELGAASSRSFDIPQSACSIPSTAVAYSLNVTVVPKASLGYLTMWPTGGTQPLVSTLNSDGRVKANAAIIPAGTNGGVSVFVTDPTNVILDIDGYFIPVGTASALAFYPVTPCRLVDTRNAAGPLGGPTLSAGGSRSFPVLSSSCALPSSASAYSLNVTAIPKGPLNYLTMWPSGQTQPLVSTLNAPTGSVTANAAIVPAGTGGDISVFVYDAADVVIDVNGYFAAPNASGLSLYTVTPCRVLDTRTAAGAFKGELTVAVESSTCAPSSTAQAYVLNATVVPVGNLSYLTLWPDGESQPVVSTLNAGDGAITSNMAIVPTNNGSIDAFSTNPTQLILDISSYFAP
jgi:hypothetical protein